MSKRSKGSLSASSENKQNKEALDSDDEPIGFDEEGGSMVEGIYIPPPVNAAPALDPDAPRLVITKIVNSFFKSYANEVYLGPFHKRFNAIVGPNGSGKSNVIDSLLFVFGYRSTKIRSKKMSTLIHNSENFKNIPSATVAVHFAQTVDKGNDDNGLDIIPGTEFVVSRTTNKDNSSFYMVNNKKAQRKEVAVLLKHHGIDLDHNRFLILQGEVEQISMMNPKAMAPTETGMLEYLEDIIGTSRYKKPLELLHEKVDVYGDARSEKLNRLNLVRKDLDVLKEPMEEAINFLKAENTVVRCRNTLYQKNIMDLEVDHEKLEADRNVVLGEVNDLQEKLEKLGAEKKEEEAILKTKSTKYDSMIKRKEDLKEAFNKANSKDVQIQADMTQINQNRKKTKQLLVEEKKKLEKLQKVPEESEKGVEECVKKEQKLTQQKEKLEKEKNAFLAEMRNETQELQERKEELETDLIVLKKAVDETKSDYNISETELKLCVSNEETERKKFEDLKAAYANTTKSIQEKSETVSKLEKEIPVTERSLNEGLRELQAVRDESNALRNNLRQRRVSVAEAKSSMQASRSRNKVLDALMQQKRGGKFPGVFGRLGDLGAINQKYDIAVSTACGPLDNIVVDTVDTAQKCIEFLKVQDIGRATFIALEKQEHLRQLATSKIQTPENVPRLYDLIRMQDERIRTAFYFALRDTLVAEDLNQASRIAYGAQRYRVVTLRGDLIETSGTMSGGGKQVSKGRMGQSVAVANMNPKDVEKLESKLVQDEQKLNELREREMTLERETNALEPKLRQMKIDLKKLMMELQSLKQQQPNLQAQLKAQEAKSKNTKADQKKVKALTEVVEKNRVKYEKACSTAQELQSQVDVITKEINDKTLGKMKVMDKNINEVSKNIDKCKAEVTRLKVAVKTAERNTKKSAEKIETMEADVENYEQRLRKMKEERDEIEADAAKLLKCIEELTEKIAEGDDVYSDQKRKVKELTDAETKLRSEKVDVDQKFKTVDKKVKENGALIRQQREKLSQLKLQQVPNETVEELKTFTREEFEEINLEVVQRDLQLVLREIKSTKPNLNIIEEFNTKTALYIERASELEEITNKRKEIKRAYDNLRDQRKQEFLTGFGFIRRKLKEMYQMITLGGDADFELVDTFDPFTEGIQFNVRPPKKSWKKISNLSGGEKTLSSLALVFALHYYKPSPLYFMDEIDAALDFKNVSIVGHYIKERTKNAQFIIISLRSNMFELCDNLVGIYKTFNCTKTITINPKAHDTPAGDKGDQVVAGSQATEAASQPKDVLYTNGDEPQSQHTDKDKEVQNNSVSDDLEMECNLDDRDLETSQVIDIASIAESQPNDEMPSQEKDMEQELKSNSLSDDIEMECSLNDKDLETPQINEIASTAEPDKSQMEV